MTTTDVKFRRATRDDADLVATIAQKSRAHFLPYLPELHGLDSVKAFYHNRVFHDCEVWVVEHNQQLVGFCAFRTGWIDHLYLLPTYVGRSLGQTLLNKAKDRHNELHLWVFQQNDRAIRFYERNGFVKLKETDGSANEERTPDMLYVWRRPPA